MAGDAAEERSHRKELEGGNRRSTSRPFQRLQRQLQKRATSRGNAGIMVELMDVATTIASKKIWSFPLHTAITHRRNLEQSSRNCSMALENATTMTTLKLLRHGCRTARFFGHPGKTGRGGNNKSNYAWDTMYVKEYRTRHGLHYHDLLARSQDLQQSA